MSASQRLGFMEIKHRLQSLEHQVASLMNLCTTFAHQIRYLKNVQDGMTDSKTSTQTSTQNSTQNSTLTQTQTSSRNDSRQTSNNSQKPLVNNFTQNSTNVREVSLSKNFPTNTSRPVSQSSVPKTSVSQKSLHTESNVSMTTEPVVKPKRKYTRRKKPEEPSQTINIE